MSSIKVKAGDMVGFSSFSLLDIGINLATRGIPFYHISHVGVIANDFAPVIYESTASDIGSCIIQKERVKGVQAHFLTQRIEAYKGKVWLYPLARSLSFSQKRKLCNYLDSQIGVQYDTLGAFRSRDLSILEKIIFRKPDLHSLFCSEYCGEAHKVIGVIDPEVNCGKLNPNKLIRLEKALGIVNNGIRMEVLA